MSDKTGALSLAVNGGNMVSVSDFAAQLMTTASGEASSTGGTGTLYLKFSGQGANYAGWMVGKDREPVDPEATFILDPQQTTIGWKCWKGGGIAEQHEWSVFCPDAAVSHDDLTYHGPYSDGDGWSPSKSIGFIGGDDPSEQYVYSATAKSALNAVDQLLSMVSTASLAGEPFIPVLTLSSEQFEAHGKKNGKPKFLVDYMATLDEVEAYRADDTGTIEDLLNGKYKEPAGADAPRRGKRGRRSAA